MKANFAIAAGSILALALAVAARSAPVAPSAAPAVAVVVSTPAQRTGLNLVIYSGGFALVRERRKIFLPAGPVVLRYEGVPATIEADSARLQAAEGAAAFAVEQQRFQPANLTPRSLLDAYAGKTVTLARYRWVGGHSIRIQIPSTLVSTNGGYIWRQHGHIAVENDQASVPEFQVPGIPPGLFAQPALVWRLRSRRAWPRTIEIQYLTRKIYWSAGYALTLDASGGEAGLAGWISIQNQSGEAFPDARVQLIAGQVNAATPPAPRPVPVYAQRALAGVAAQAAAPPPVTAQKVYAYHLFTIHQPVSVAKQGEERVGWLAVAKVPVRKRYVIHGARAFYGGFVSGSQAEPVNVELTIQNQGSGLGRALPGGVVRVYGPGPDGENLFLGADRIGDIAAGEKIDLQPGGAFDVTARRVETRFQRISQQKSQVALRVTVKNATGQPVRVRDDEPLMNGSAVVRSSQKFTQPNAGTARFEILVPARGEASFTYSVEQTY